MGAFGGVPLDMDPVSGERWDDGLEAEAPSAAERIAHLEWLLDRASGNLADQAKLIRDQKAERDQLRDQLERANRRFEVARSAGSNALGRVAELEMALEQRNDQLATATDAAEEYRMERDAARATIDAIGRLIDPQDS